MNAAFVRGFVDEFEKTAEGKKWIQKAIKKPGADELDKLSRRTRLSEALKKMNR